MTTTKITKKMYFETLQDLIGLAEETGFDGFDFKALNDFCANEISQLEKKAEKARERAEKARKAVDVLKDMILEVITADPMTKDEIVAAIQKINPELEIATPGRVITRLSALINEGIITKNSITVGETGAKRKVMVYALRSENE